MMKGPFRIAPFGQHLFFFKRWFFLPLRHAAVQHLPTLCFPWINFFFPISIHCYVERTLACELLSWQYEKCTMSQLAKIGYDVGRPCQIYMFKNHSISALQYILSSQLLLQWSIEIVLAWSSAFLTFRNTVRKLEFLTLCKVFTNLIDFRNAHACDLCQTYLQLLILLMI